MKTNNLRTKYNRLLERVIRLCMLTGITFVVTACYGPEPPEGFYDQNSPEYQRRKELKERVEKMAKETDDSSTEK